MIGALKHLVHFGHAVETGSITAAAGKLGVSPSVISASVRIVETQIGTTLLERRKSGVRMTPAAEDVYAEARTVMSALDRLEHLRGPRGAALSGPVRVSLPVEVSCGWVSGALLRLHQTAPEVELLLHPEDRVVDHLKFSRDLHLRIGGAPQVDGLKVLHAGTAQTALVVRPDLLEGRDPADPGTAEALTLLASLGTSRDGFKLASGQRLRFGAMLWVDAIQTRVDMARRGLGAVACLRPTFAAELARGEMVELVPSAFARTVQIVIGTPHQQPSRAIRHVAGAFAEDML